MQSSNAEAAAEDDVLAFTRIFDAPRALVWRLWADPQHRLRWWGPEGMGLSELEMDFREGGAWRMVMHHLVTGYDHPVHGVFREIREPNRLSFTYINDSDGIETLVTMDFADLGGRTEMRFRQSPFAAAEDRNSHGWGWGSTLGLLDEYLQRIDRANPLPAGPPRIDGVAADIVAARKRYEEDLANGVVRERHPGEPK
jgi:uncharacterized protein YndB with AHSA1/START domain